MIGSRRQSRSAHRSTVAKHRLRVLICLVAALAVGPRVASAQRAHGDIEAYRELVARAAEQFRDGEFGAARESFLAAYEIHPEPVLLYNVAGTYRREGKPAEAIEYYQRFLDRAPRDHDHRVKARAYIEELQAELADTAAGESGGSEAAEYEPAHGRSGLDRDREALRETPRRPDLTSSPRRAGRRERLAGIALGVASGVLLAAALQQHLSSRSTIDDIADLPAGTPWDEGLDNRYADSRDAERRAKVLALVGSATAIAGAVTYILGERKRRAAEEHRDRRAGWARAGAGARGLSLLPSVSSGGAGVIVRGEF